MSDASNTEVLLDRMAKMALQVEVLTAQVNSLAAVARHHEKLIAGVRAHNERLLDDVKNKKRRLQAAGLA